MVYRDFTTRRHCCLNMFLLVLYWPGSSRISGPPTPEINRQTSWFPCSKRTTGSAEDIKLIDFGLSAKLPRDCRYEQRPQNLTGPMSRIAKLEMILLHDTYNLYMNNIIIHIYICQRELNARALIMYTRDCAFGTPYWLKSLREEKKSELCMQCRNAVRNYQHYGYHSSITTYPEQGFVLFTIYIHISYTYIIYISYIYGPTFVPTPFHGHGSAIHTSTSTIPLPPCGVVVCVCNI